MPIFGNAWTREEAHFSSLSKTSISFSMKNSNVYGFQFYSCLLFCSPNERGNFEKHFLKNCTGPEKSRILKQRC